MIYKRASGKYAARIEQDSNGVRVRRSLGTFRTKKEAEQAHREALTARDRGIDLSPRNVMIADLMARYLADRQTRCGAKTLQEYERKAALYILPTLGRTTLAKLRPAHVAEWQSTLKNSGGLGGRPLSSKTVFHARSLLYGSLQWAVKMQLVVVNVCAVVDAPKVRRSAAKALSTEEVTRLLAVADKTRWGPLVVLAFATGARRGELLAARWDNVNEATKSLVIESSLSQTKARGVTVKGTKTDNARTIPLSRVALEALKRMRVQQAADKLRLGAAYKASGFIFTDEAGSILSPMALTSAYARMARRAGISSTRFHDARHTAASRMLASGVDIRTVSAILGHASAVITLGIYAHLLGESTRSAIDILGDALDAKAK